MNGFLPIGVFHRLWRVEWAVAIKARPAQSLPWIAFAYIAIETACHPSTYGTSSIQVFFHTNGHRMALGPRPAPCSDLSGAQRVPQPDVRSTTVQGNARHMDLDVLAGAPRLPLCHSEGVRLQSMLSSRLWSAG